MIIRLLKLIAIALIVFIVLTEIESLLGMNMHEKINPDMYALTYNPELPSVIMEDVKKGEAIASASKIAICCLARNCEKLVAKNVKRLESIGKQFSEYKIVIFENDSSDNTRELFKKENVDLIKCDKLGSTECIFKYKEGYTYGLTASSRIKKMGFYREQYLDHVKNHYSHYDYMLVVDFDLDGGTNLNGLFHSLSQKDCGAISINGRIHVIGTFGAVSGAYDALAFISKENDYNDYKLSNNSIKSVVKNYISMNYTLYNTHELVEVKSAFNGYTLYKMDALKNTSYNGDYQCEHINLAESISRNGFKIYINPLWKGHFNQQGPSGGLVTLTRKF